MLIIENIVWVYLSLWKKIVDVLAEKKGNFVKTDEFKHGQT